MQKRRLPFSVLLLALGACTSPWAHEGTLAPASKVLADASFTLTSIPGANDVVARDTVSLVRRALAAKGYRETPNGRYRLDVGLATPPLEVAVQSEHGSLTHRKKARRPIILCRHRRYVLTIGMIDRANGEVLFRNATAARRCGASLVKLLPRLVDVAVNGGLSPQRAPGS
jgi:hypothetical protein